MNFHHLAMDGMAKVENLAPFSKLGKVNEKHALKYAKEVYGEGSYAVVKLESATNAYEMDLEKFIEHATEISVEQAKKNNR